MKTMTAVILAVLAAPGTQAAPPVPPRPVSQPARAGGPAVGMMQRAWVDPARRNWTNTGPRPLATVVWYPAAPGAPLVDVLAGQKVPFRVPLVAAGAPLAPGARKYPLVVLSHGTGGAAVSLMWLGHALAAHGYIVAAVNHHGNNALEPPTPQGFLLPWERATDLSLLITQMLADPQFGPRIDPARIGATGFSLGGFTVIELAGGRIDFQAFLDFCASPERDFTCAPQPEFPEAWAQFNAIKDKDPQVIASLKRSGDSYRDERVRAAFAMAPALGEGFSEARLNGVTIPVQIVIGGGDTVTPLETNAERFSAFIPGAKLTVLDGPVQHYDFLDECTPEAAAAVPLCQEKPGVDRARVHAKVEEMAIAFFDAAWSRPAR